MSFAADILKKINYKPEPVVSTARQREHSAKPEIPAETVLTDRGPMRITKNGKIDGRSLQRGKPKPRNAAPRGVRAYEHVILRDIFEKSQPGDEYAWEWRTEGTYGDIKMRNAQLAYVYKIANIYDHKVSVFARKAHVVIKYVGSKA